MGIIVKRQLLSLSCCEYYFCAERVVYACTVRICTERAPFLIGSSNILKEIV